MPALFWRAPGILPVCGARRLDASASRFSTATQPYAFPPTATGGGQARFPLRVRIPFHSSKKKQTPTDVDACSFLACLEGFEPPTLWFVAKYSIQLSYKHILLSFVCSNPGFYPFAVPEDSMPPHLAFRPLHNPVPSLHPPQAAVRLGSPDPLVRSQILYGAELQARISNALTMITHKFEKSKSYFAKNSNFIILYSISIDKRFPVMVY